MLEGKAHVEDTDMPVMMQIQALSSAYQALDIYDVVDTTSIAAHIKRSLTRGMGKDGNVWWVRILDVSSLIPKGASSTSHSRPSNSSSSKGLSNSKLVNFR